MGTSNTSECKSDIKKLLPNTECDHKSCSFLNVYQPPLGNSTFTVRKLQFASYIML